MSKRTSVPLAGLIGILGSLTTITPARADGAACLGDACGEAPACAATDGVADLDIPTVRIAGDFRINGAAPFWLPSHTGTLELRSPTLGTVLLGSTHQGSYQRVILPGTYDIVYRHVAGTLVPQNKETVIAHDVELFAAQTLDISVPAVVVSGDITLAGAPPPASIYEQGQVRLRDRETGAHFSVGTSFGGSYTAVVIPGDYDVVYSHLLGELVPRNERATLIADVHVDGSPLDVDIPTVERTGSFTIDGAAAPASIYENGQVYLRGADDDIFPLGQTRDGTYEVKVVPGSYDVIYSHLIGSTIVPRNPFAVVTSDASMLAAGSLAINVPTVAIAGDFRLDGGAFPNSIYENARLWLRGGNGWDLVPLGQTRDQGFAGLRVVPGSYDVVYQALLTDGLLIPANPWVDLEHRRSISAARGVRKVDVNVLSGMALAELTLWGETPPDSVYERGLLRARPLAAGGAAFDLLDSRDGGGGKRVVAGAYGLSWRHLLGDTHVPVNGDAAVGTTTAQLLLPPIAAIDLQPGPLAGTFTLGQQPFPAAGQDARLRLRDVITGDLIELGSASAGGYQVMLLGGTYQVVYDHLAGGSVPANQGATLGCLTFTPTAPSQPVGGRDDELPYIARL